MPRTIMESVNDILKQEGGTPTGGGGNEKNRHAILG